MVNVLIPAGGKSMFYKDGYFPKLMYEVAGKTMLERVVENYQKLEDCHFTFVFANKDCTEFHLDDSAKILTEPKTNILILDNDTAGALCTCLMAVKIVGNDAPLIIANCDQVIDVDFNEVLTEFRKNGCVAGVVTFESIHPRWSYARVDGNRVIEVAEKRPISKHAIAGLYYFEKGGDFIESAQQVIYKENELNGKFYISSSLNEIILLGGKVGFFEVARNCYHSFYSPEKIKEYERSMGVVTE